MKTPNYFLVGIVFLHAFILRKLIFFPYPELFIYPYLVNQGLLPYKQIFDQHFPGFMFFPINLGTLGMTTPEVARWWLIAVVVITHVLIFWIGKSIFRNIKLALVGNFLYLIWQPFFEGYTLWIDSFIPVLLLPAFYFTWRGPETRNKKDAFLSGFFLSLALLLKQVVLPIIILVVFLFWARTNLRSLGYLLLGSIPPIFITILWVISLGIATDFWYWTVIYNLTVFAQYGRKLPDFTHIVRAGFVFGVALVAWLLVWRSQKRFTSQPIFLAGLFMLATFIFAATRFDFVHLQPALPFMVLVTASSVPMLARVPWGKAGIVGYMVVIFVWLSVFYRGHIGERIFFFDEHMQRVAAKTKELTKPGDTIFVFGIHPHLYQMTKTLPPGRVFVFQFPWFMRVAQQRILAGIINDPPKLVVRDLTAEVDNQKLVSQMEKINRYVEENYRLQGQIGSVEFLVK